ncbi:MAG TPA: VOC family protein [Thermoplasmata archaeon]|nr:VOC family protein [Thermoplasmata archaeon]
MGTSIQVVFDCADPDRLAKFWAAALHYKLQDPPAGYPSWHEFLRARGVPEAEWNAASAIVDPEKVGPRIYFQQMDTPKPKKNRVHLDINISGGRTVPDEERVKRVNAEVERILGLGATKQHVWDDPGEYTIVMQDPECNEFCVQ